VKVANNCFDRRSNALQEAISHGGLTRTADSIAAVAMSWRAVWCCYDVIKPLMKQTVEYSLLYPFNCILFFSVFTCLLIFVA